MEASLVGPGRPPELVQFSRISFLGSFFLMSLFSFANPCTCVVHWDENGMIVLHCCVVCVPVGSQLSVGPLGGGALAQPVALCDSLST